MATEYQSTRGRGADCADDGVRSRDRRKDNRQLIRFVAANFDAVCFDPQTKISKFCSFSHISICVFKNHSSRIL